MPLRAYIITSSIILVLVAVLQLSWFVGPVEVQVQGYRISLWLSMVSALVGGFMVYLGFRSWPMRTYACPSCGKRLRARAESSGKEIVCPHCHNHVSRYSGFLPATNLPVLPGSGLPLMAKKAMATQVAETRLCRPVPRNNCDIQDSRVAEARAPVPLYLDGCAGHQPQTERKTPAIPGYEILEELGRGGMGVVYKARHEKLNRLVALKMTRGGGLADQAQVDRFLAEAEAVAKLEHPNLVRLYEIGEYQGLPYYTMEFVPGGSLARMLDQGILPAYQAARLVQHLAQGMHYAHERGIVHRDLKPSNVLLQKDEGDTISAEADEHEAESSFLLSSLFIPKITDFGLAKRIEVSSDLTASGAILGTPLYMAPEQAEGKGNEVGPAADVYALGAILYQCLTGRPPVREASTDEPMSPARLNPKVPRDLETICLKCLQKEPRKRYASAADLTEDLKRFQAGEPIVARPVSAAERTWKWIKRRPAAAALIVVLVVSGVLALGLALWALGERDDAISARKTADQRTIDADQQRKNAQRQAALSMYEQALFRCQQERAARGMLWLARSLKEAVKLETADVEESIRHQLAAWSRDLQPLTSVLAHRDSVNAVCFSPDSKIVLTASGDSTGQLWEAATGKPLGPPLQHQLPVLSAAFSPDGKTIVTGSVDNTARLWEVATSKPLVAPFKHRGAVLSVAFSPDGKTVLTGSSDKTARLWEAATGTPIGPPLPHQDAVVRVAFSPDGQTGLTGSLDKTARLWEAATGKSLGPALRHQSHITDVAFGSNGKNVLTGSSDQTARLWDAATGQPLGPVFHHQAAVLAVAFSPDGRTVLTGSEDRTARLWEAATGKPLGPPLLHRDFVVRLAFSHDGKTILTGSWDKTARLWDAATGKALSPSLKHQAAVLAVAFSPDGRTVLTGGRDNTARLWDAAAGKPFARLPHQSVLCAACNRDGAILTGGRDKTARLWDAVTRKPLGPPLHHHSVVHAVAFSPDGKTVLTGSNDGTARLWEASTGQAVGPLLQHHGLVRAVAFSPDGRTVLTGGNDGKVRLWDAATGKPLASPLRHKGTVSAVAFSPDGKTVLMGDEHDLEQLGQAATEKPLHLPLQHPFNPSGKTLTGSHGTTARLWELATGKPLGQPLQHQGVVRAAAFSHDGKTVLTGSGDHTARLWDASTGRPLGPPLQHQDSVMAVAFSPNGKMVLTGSDDKTARLWETDTGQPLGPPLQHRDAVRAVAFSHVGKTVLTGSEGKTARLWKVLSPVQGDPARIVLWLQVVTGMVLDEHDSVRVLDAAAWETRRQELEKFGGPPGLGGELVRRGANRTSER